MNDIMFSLSVRFCIRTSQQVFSPCSKSHWPPSLFCFRLGGWIQRRDASFLGVLSFLILSLLQTPSNDHTHSLKLGT